MLSAKSWGAEFLERQSEGLREGAQRSTPGNSLHVLRADPGWANLPRPVPPDTEGLAALLQPGCLPVSPHQPFCWVQLRQAGTFERKSSSTELRKGKGESKA